MPIAEVCTRLANSRANYELPPKGRTTNLLSLCVLVAEEKNDKLRRSGPIREQQFDGVGSVKPVIIEGFITFPDSLAVLLFEVISP